jgi:MFS family permease
MLPPYTFSMSGNDSSNAQAVRFTRIIPALGIAQIISWGSLYYSIAVLASPVETSLGISQTWLFGAFTIGMLVSGAASPTTGRLIDEHGGRIVLTVGSLVGALAFLVLALAQNAVTFVFGWVLGGLAMAATLYDPAFATLHQLSREHYRRSVTSLTLIAGFASTVFWPLTGWLESAIGWRGAFGAFAVLHLAVCLPLHWFVIPRVNRLGHAIKAELPAGGEQSTQSASYYWLATAFSIAMFVMAVIFAHLIEMLKARGISSGDAILVGSLIGPTQVIARIVEFGLARHARATRVGLVAFGMFAVAILVLAFAGQSLWWAFAFAILFGASNGVMTIVRGTAPAELFGQRQLGSLLGRLARPAFAAKAIAPVTFAALIAHGVSSGWAEAGLAVVAILGFVSFVVAVRPAKSA